MPPLPSPISAVPRPNLRTIQTGTLRYTWRGVVCSKNPFDLALYPILLWKEKPATIIEIGSKEGGVNRHSKGTPDRRPKGTLLRVGF